MDPARGASSVEVRLRRGAQSFAPGDRLEGEVVIRTPHAAMDVQGVRLELQGASSLHLNARNVGLLEAFYSSIQPQVFLEKEIVLAQATRVRGGEIAIPFGFVLAPSPSLQETYHGVYITTAYVLKAEVPRGLLSSTLTHEVEVFVEIPGAGAADDERDRASREETAPAGPAVRFEISPDSLENVNEEERSRIPRFAICGALDRLRCPITSPLTGEVRVDVSELPVQSIDLQLVRVESIEYAEGIAQEATEIQSLQIASGDVCREFTLPIDMPFPRFFTCASMKTRQFKVDFELNLLVTLGEDTVISESFPLRIYRPRIPAAAS